VFGAIYLDGGFKPCEEAILYVCAPFIARLPDASDLKDPKTRLQEWLQGHGFALPAYSLLSDTGPSHKKQFLVQCAAETVGVKVVGEGGSRQKAEQAAAAAALDSIAEMPKR